MWTLLYHLEICDWLIEKIKKKRHKRICGLTLGPTFTGHKSKNYIFSYTLSIHYNEICNFNGGLNTKVIGNLNLNYMLIALLPWFSLATNSLIYYPIPWFVLAINILVWSSIIWKVNLEFRKERPIQNK